MFLNKNIENKLFKLKFFIKKNFNFIHYLWKLRFHKNFFYKFISNNKKIIFDNSKNSKELLAINDYNEKYIVNSNDKTIGRKLYIEGSFEFDNFLYVSSILKNKIKFTNLIDVGANIGSICIPAIKRGVFKKALAIEPEPYNFDLLTKNIFINNLTEKIQILNLALSNSNNKEIQFGLSLSNYADHRIKSDTSKINYFDEDKCNYIYVKSSKLDNLIANYDPSETLIWIDVQGYEGFVLEGSINFLNKKPPIVIEFWPYGLDRYNSYNLLKKILIKLDYKNCHNINTKSNIGNLNEKILDDIYYDYKSRYTDFTNLLLF